jgi:hypothetical protein
MIQFAEEAAERIENAPPEPEPEPAAEGAEAQAGETVAEEMQPTEEAGTAADAQDDAAPSDEDGQDGSAPSHAESLAAVSEEAAHGNESAPPAE